MRGSILTASGSRERMKVTVDTYLCLSSVLSFLSTFQSITLHTKPKEYGKETKMEKNPLLPKLVENPVINGAYVIG